MTAPVMDGTPPVSAEARTARHEAEVRREMRLTSSWWSRIGIVVFIVAGVLIPLSSSNALTISLLTSGAVYGIGAIGMNVLNGYAGQVSMGHAFFVAAGAFTAVVAGSKWHWPLPLWIIAAGVVGAVLGALVAPLALRLQGIYQLILTLGLVYIGAYIFTNWTSVSGGDNGISANLPLSLGFVDFGKLVIGNEQYSYSQGLLLVSWLLCGLCVLLVHNIMRSRSGRAMTAVRDAGLAAEVAGVSPARTKINVFALSSALAAVCGALLAAQLQYVSITEFDYTLSIQFIVMIIVGGVGTSWGPVIGALAISAIPLYITTYAASIPFVKQPTSSSGGFGIQPGQLSLVVYGLLLAVFLVAQPRGLVGLAKGLLGLVTRGRRGAARATG
ncbi:MAG TPA: branched-chain amino acid ABC transporter permease [Trebonia sp.]